MQALYPLVTADFTNKSKQPVNKLEIFVECSAYDLCDFYGKNYLIEAHYSSGERQLSYSPVAAEFTAVIDNTEGLFHPKNTDSPFYSYLKVGRKMIFHTGFKKDGIDYLWQWFEGIISDVQIDTTSHQIIIKGFDYTQYLTEVKLKSPDNYWGSHLDTVTVADQAGYDMPVGCNGAYIAYLDGVQIYAGDYWIYDEGSNKFFFLPSKIPVADDIPLVIYYYTTQVPENVIADLLVAADLYPTQAAALANMDYTATGADDDIARVRFNTGVSVFYAIQKICERVDYEFYFKYDGTPLFKPIATVGASQFTFGKELISTFEYIENIDEVRNHIVIEGEEYSIYDELYRILDGTEIMYTLDDIPDGDSYGRMALTSISAGKIIIAGCDAEVTDQMFTAPAARNNVEAWKHASDVTMIDGGKIYTNSIILANVSGDLDDIANGATYGKVNLTCITAGNIVLAQCSGDLDDIAEGTNYGKVALTSIGAGKIIVAGLDDDVIGRIFSTAAKQTLIEAGKIDIYGGMALQNMLKNGGFEDGDVHWSTGAQISVEAAGGDNSNKYLELTRAGADVYCYQKNIDTSTRYFEVNAGETYDWGASLKRTGACEARVYLRWYDKDKVEIAQAAIISTSAAWETKSLVQIMPATAKFAKLFCYLYTGNADDTACFDNVYLKRVDEKAWSFTHASDRTTIDGGKLYTYSIECNKLLVGSDANQADTLDVYQGEDDTQIFRLRSTSINHQITQGGGLGYDWGTHTDCYFYMRKDVAATGGVFMASFTEASQDISFELYAIYGAANTAKDGNASGAINFAGLKADPANHSYKAALANENIFCLKTKPTGGSYQAIFIVDEDGDVLYDGTIGAFQDEDDIELLKELEDILGDRISKTEMKKKDVFKKHKVVHVNEVDEEKHGKEGKLIKTGTKRLDRFISTKRLNMLLMGSIRQLNEKIEKLEARI